jgi:hypothetical protein
MLDFLGFIATAALLLAAAGRLAGPFPHFTGWGDIITGVFALPVAWLARDVRPRHLNAIAAWDLFGAADLVLAITLGVTSAEGSPLQTSRLLRVRLRCSSFHGRSFRLCWCRFG